MKNKIGKTDCELKNDVLSELEYEPSIRVTDIGVLVKNGAVTLNGYATSHGARRATLHAAKRVAGVNAIADNIEVRLPKSIHHTDGDIAAAAAKKIEWSPSILNNTVNITVSLGWITLEGEVEWWYQKDAAEKAVDDLPGVKGVTNSISINPSLTAEEVEASIHSAFRRSALLDGDNIEVDKVGKTVVLKGRVRNHPARDEAERIAWAAPGIDKVDNQITIKWSWFENSMDRASS